LRNYYEILGIETAADGKEVKRAYFAAVKKFPPERFPEEFKDIRAAYDCLFNPESRKAYDLKQSLSDNEKKFSDEADKHSGEGKTGLAVAACEKLYKSRPDSPEFSLKLAEAYLERGWHKKAGTQFRKTLELDESLEKAWLGLADCYKTAGDIENAKTVYDEAIEALGRHGKESLEVYSGVFIINIEGFPERSEEMLKKTVALIKKNCEDPKELETTISAMLLVADYNESYFLLPIFKEALDAMPYASEKLRERFKQCELVSTLNDFLDSDSEAEAAAHDILMDEILRKEEKSETKKDRAERLSMECLILYRIDEFRSKLLRLKAEHPELYAFYAKFFDSALMAKDSYVLANRKLNELNRLGYSPTFLRDEAKPETFRREEPKIGRNDPCPCGSGKKYKKCCGA
jgi:curved DNA-binding protein CbpA